MANITIIDLNLDAQMSQLKLNKLSKTLGGYDYSLPPNLQPIIPGQRIFPYGGRLKDF